MVSHRSLSHSKSFQVSRTLLSILADLNNVVVWMISSCPLISKSSRLFTNPLVTVLSTPITIGITVTFICHCFFSFLARSRHLSFFLHSFNLTLWSARYYYHYCCYKYYCFHYYSFCIFFTPVVTGGFYWSDSKSPQFSNTLCSILADLSNNAVWTVSFLGSLGLF